MALKVSQFWHFSRPVGQTLDKVLSKMAVLKTYNFGDRHKFRLIRHKTPPFCIVHRQINFAC